MTKKSLKSSLASGDKFIVTAELTPGPGYNFKPIEHFLNQYAQDGNGSGIPSGFELVGLTIPQNPGGVANLEPADILSMINSRDLLADLEYIPHMSCKDHNADALFSALLGYRSRGVESILALTGDKPVSAKGVFELGAMGLLQLINRMNNETYLKAKPENIENVHQFFPGAAVSPFKYTEASQMQQYFKMENKIACGARFLITQVGWDWRKSLEILEYMKRNSITTPLIGNVYFLTTTNPAPRLMHDIKLPGCFVSDELLAKLESESLDQHIERAAQQVAMYKSIGAAGIDLGGVHDFDTFKQILNTADQIGDDWEKHKDNLYWPAKDAWYLYDKQGRETKLSKKKKTMRHRFFKAMHRAVLDPDYKGFALNKKFMKLIGADKGKGFMYKSVFCGEKLSKYLIFDCEECGDCFLPENFGLCTIGGCEKGLDNAPCGDSTADGYCGNNLERLCIGEYIYNAAASEPSGLNKLRRTINQPRKSELENTSSVVNYVFGFDHTGAMPIVNIGDGLNSAVPGISKVLSEFDSKNFDTNTPEYEYIKAIIQFQSDQGASYILVDVDSMDQGDTAATANRMSVLVEMVRKYGRGAAVYARSQHLTVLERALKHWYNTPDPVGKPMLGYIDLETSRPLMNMRKDYDFVFMAWLGSESYSGDIIQQSATVESMFDRAKRIYSMATGEYNFAPEDICFDVMVTPLSEDIDLEAGRCGGTFRTMKLIEQIKKDSSLKKAKTCGIIELSAVKMPRKIGVMRAYVAVAMKAGLDAGIVAPQNKFGLKDPDAKLVETVEAFAKLDGSSGPAKTAKQKLDENFGSKKKAS